MRILGSQATVGRVAAAAVAVLAVASAGIGPVAGAATSPAVPLGHGAPVVKPLVPPPGQRGRASTRAADHLRIHGRGVPIVSLAPEVYLVFWGSQWSNDPVGAAPALQSFYQGLGGADDTWSSILSQYCTHPPKTAGLPTSTCDAKSKFIQHPATTPLRGVWFDNTGPAPTNGTISDLAFEVLAAAQHFGRTNAKLNKNTQYVIASPNGTFPDGFPDFCAYHSWVSFRGLGKLVFTNLPYVPALPADACTIIPSPNPVDGYLVSASHEYGESVTDFKFAATERLVVRYRPGHR